MSARTKASKGERIRKPGNTPRSVRYQVQARLNAICPWFTMFPLDFPVNALKRLPPGTWVLDPFCGRGTTLFAARLLGLPAVGIDSHPVAAAIAKAKLLKVEPLAVTSLAEDLLAAKVDDVPEGDFWSLAFHRETLADLTRLRVAFAQPWSDEPAVVALRALMLGVLHGPLTKGTPSYCSNQMPRTYATKPRAAVRFWKRHGLFESRHVDVLDLVKRRTNYVFAQVPATVAGAVREGDARNETSQLRRRFGAIVTSPPYLGMRTYRPDQWLRLWLLGGPPEPQYSAEGQLRHLTDEAFVSDLARVWKTAATRCDEETRMVVRFGSIGSRRRDPAKLLRDSLIESAMWRVRSIRAAGNARRGTRQSDQFRRDIGVCDEVDCVAELVG